MIALALDTSSKEGSLALVRDGTVVECATAEAHRTHGERLPGELAELLARHGLSPGAVDVYGVAAGPGSFTGLRVGLATIQAVALVTGRPVVAVSSLVALAAAVVPPEATDLVGVWIDAERGEVFAALYERCPSGEDAEDESRTEPERPPPGWRVLSPSSVGTPEAIRADWAPLVGRRPLVLVGDGAVKYRALFCGPERETVRIIAPPPVAPVIGRLALARLKEGATVSPYGVRPVYVRRPDAELARERRERLERHP